MKFHISNPFDPPPAPPAFGSGKILPEKSSPLVFYQFKFSTHARIDSVIRILSRLIFHWLSPFLEAGFSRPLEPTGMSNPNPSLCQFFINDFCRSLGTSTVSVNVRHYRQSWKEFLFTMSTGNAPSFYEHGIGNAEYHITDIISFTK